MTKMQLSLNLPNYCMIFWKNNFDSHGGVDMQNLFLNIDRSPILRSCRTSYNIVLAQRGSQRKVNSSCSHGICMR